MSRQHKTGKLSKREKEEIERRIMMEEFMDELNEHEQREVSKMVTIAMYVIQYLSVHFDVFIDKFPNIHCRFWIKAKNKISVALNACNDFVKIFEGLIHPDNRDDFNRDYNQYQLVNDNWICEDVMRYEKDSDAPRAREICKSAALRYHDPLETNLQRTFEDGFRRGAAYADLHPCGYMDIKVGEKKERKTYEELAEYYAYHKLLKGEEK